MRTVWALRARPDCDRGLRSFDRLQFAIGRPRHADIEARLSGSLVWKQLSLLKYRKQAFSDHRAHVCLSDSPRA